MKLSNTYTAYMTPAWSGIGTTINETLSSIEALEKTGLNFEVKKLPNSHIIGDKVINSQNSFFTYRTDNNEILGDKLGNVYEVVQNCEAFAVIDDLIKIHPNIEIDAGGVLDNGRISFISLKMPNLLEVAQNDAYREYILITNSFDGTSKIRAYFTNIRIKCSNVLSYATKKGKNYVGNGYEIKHTCSASGRLKQAIGILEAQKQSSKMTLAAFQKMHGTPFSKSQMRDFAFNILLNDPEITSIQEGRGVDNVVGSLKMRHISEIIDFTTEGVGQSDILSTAWGAYNGVTGYYTNLKTFKNAEERFSNLMLPQGTAGQHMGKAFELALNPKLIKPVKALNYN